MPVYMIYILMALALGTAGGIGFNLGGGISSFLSIVGLVVIIGILWKPLLEPIIERIAKK